MSHFQDIQASVHAFHTFGRQTCTVPAALAEAIIVPSECKEVLRSAHCPERGRAYLRCGVRGHRQTSQPGPRGTQRHA